MLGRTIWLHTAALLCAAAALPAQRTWIVNDLGGPGVDHQTFMAAYDAASSGDTIILEPGSGGVISSRGRSRRG